MKTQKKDDRPGKGWLTKRELAAALDVSLQQFDRGYRRYVDEAAQREVDGRLYFHGRSVLDRWKESGASPTAIKQPGGESDPLLQGPPTEWLEEYRKQRALQEEIKLEQMRGNTVAVADIEPPLLNLCGVLRRAGETLARRWGNDAAQVLNEAVDEWESGCESVVGEKAKAKESDETNSSAR